MRVYQTNEIKNIALVGSAGSGQDYSCRKYVIRSRRY